MTTLHRQFDRMTQRHARHAHVIPFAAMTPDQQVDHLMDAHGFDEDYYAEGPTGDDGPTREEVRARWLAEDPRDRTLYHDEDGEDSDDVLAFRHRHDKDLSVDYTRDYSIERPKL